MRLCNVRCSSGQGVSVGYNSTGKKVSASRMEPYGEVYGPKDRITVLVDLTGDHFDLPYNPYITPHKYLF